jgi:hypothetical protein
MSEKDKEEILEIVEEFMEWIKSTAARGLIKVINYENRWVMNKVYKFKDDHGVSIQELYEGIYLYKKNE